MSSLAASPAIDSSALERFGYGVAVNEVNPGREWRAVRKRADRRKKLRTKAKVSARVRCVLCARESECRVHSGLSGDEGTRQIYLVVRIGTLSVGMGSQGTRLEGTGAEEELAPTPVNAQSGPAAPARIEFNATTERTGKIRAQQIRLNSLRFTIRPDAKLL